MTGRGSGDQTIDLLWLLLIKNDPSTNRVSAEAAKLKSIPDKGSRLGWETLLYSKHGNCSEVLTGSGLMTPDDQGR